MFETKLKWTFKINDKEFNLYLDGDSSIGAVKEVGNQIIAHCINVENQIKAQQEAEKLKEEASKVEVIPENQPQEQTAG